MGKETKARKQEDTRDIFAKALSDIEEYAPLAGAIIGGAATYRALRRGQMVPISRDGKVKIRIGDRLDTAPGAALGAMGGSYLGAIGSTALHGSRGKHEHKRRK